MRPFQKRESGFPGFSPHPSSIAKLSIVTTAYAKIFESLFDGSLRGRPDEILVFVNLLTHARNGIADIHFKKIADETGIDTCRVKAACVVLESPDPDSRTPDEQGCRIKRLDDHRDWGWRIVNHQKYRMLGGQDDRTKELTRNRVANFRARKQQNVAFGNVTKTLPPASVYGSGSESVPEETVKDNPNQDRRLELKQKLCAAFNRNDLDVWSYAEEHALFEVSKRENCVGEFIDLINFRARRGKYFPQSIIRLLENWSQNLDACRNGNSLTESPVVVMKAIEEEIAEHPANRESCYYQQNCTEQQKSNLKSLREKLKTIRGQIANG